MDERNAIGRGIIMRQLSNRTLRKIVIPRETKKNQTDGHSKRFRDNWPQPLHHMKTFPDSILRIHHVSRTWVTRSNRTPFSPAPGLWIFFRLSSTETTGWKADVSIMSLSDNVCDKGPWIWIWTWLWCLCGWGMLRDESELRSLVRDMSRILIILVTERDRFTDN